jgi:hypothetical protein
MGHATTVEVLLEHGALMQFDTNKGETARTLALSAGHAAVVCILDEAAVAERSQSRECALFLSLSLSLSLSFSLSLSLSLAWSTQEV